MNRREIERALKDYHWMVKEIARLCKVLGGAGERLCRQYGIESTLPKPKGINTDIVYNEVARRERLWKHLEQLVKKVAFVESHMHLINNDRERTVLYCLLEGMPIAEIARHMKMSERQVFRTRDNIVSRMAGMSGMSGLSRNLNKEKTCV